MKNVIITNNTAAKSRKVSGNIAAPVSKSDAHRAMICAALSGGETFVAGRHPSADMGVTAECLSALGVGVEFTGDGYHISGRLRGGGKLDCGESGSTLRFLLPIAAVTEGETEFVGSGKLPLRPLLPLTEQLRQKGAYISGDLLPLTVRGKARGGEYEMPGNISSQFISGLLMALPLCGEKSTIRLTTPLQSAMYADMTLNTLSRFGINWTVLPENKEFPYSGYTLDSSASTPVTPGIYNTEGDWSGAAFFAVLAALGGKISVSGLDLCSLQPDKKIYEIVGEFGARTDFRDGVMTVEKDRACPFSADVSAFPDLFPVLAVLACGAEGKSLLYNASRLRIKESDRIETTAALIRALGGCVNVTDDSLEIFGTGSLSGGTADGANDHRIVMSGAVASVISENDVTITGCEAINKSYPGFFDDFSACGGEYRYM